MTHPLTPREKVAQAIRAHVQGVDSSGCIAARLEGVDDAADAILTALASGSGDHAELARLAEAADRPIPTKGSGKRGRWQQANRLFHATASPATVLALLAEIAALRGVEARAIEDLEKIGSLYMEAAYQRGEAEDRATEAERKLAEAVGLLEVCETSMDAGCVGSHRIALNTIRAFLSKEAERG